MPKNPLYTFLKHRAIRICVSQEVGQMLWASGQVEGPLFVIPNGSARGLEVFSFFNVFFHTFYEFTKATTDNQLS